MRYRFSHGVVAAGVLALTVLAAASRTGHVQVLAAAQPTAPPNILLVIADDFGVDTSPCYPTDTDKPSMPTLARLCQEGLVFDQYWTPPECSPTRATILTGRYGVRTGIGSAVSRASTGLSTTELGLQKYLTQSGTGVASAVIGKWHLASDANGWLDHPARMGVTHYDGLLTGAADSYSRWSRTVNGQASVSTTYITSQSPVLRLRSGVTVRALPDCSSTAAVVGAARRTRSTSVPIVRRRTDGPSATSDTS